MRRRLILLLLLVSLLAAGCSRVTRKNYERIETGMSYGEVVEILGEPDDSESVGIGPFSASTASWKGSEGTISIQFVNEKAQVKSFTRPDEEP